MSAAAAGTGGGNTPVLPRFSTNLLIDWLAYTSPHDTGIAELWRGSGPLPWRLADRGGRYGYERMYKLGAVELNISGPADTDCMELSGGACRDLEGMAGSPDHPFEWGDHLADLLDLGRSVSRLDFSIDVRGSGFSVEDFAAAIREERFKAPRWTRKSIIEIKGLCPDSGSGHTIYMGSAKSDSRLLIYDKKIEAGMGKESNEWVRIEWRTRHETAKAMTRCLSVNGLRDGLSALNSYVEFWSPDGTNLPIWEAATRNVNPVPLEVHQRGGTLASTRHWIHTQAAAAIAMLAEVDGAGDLDYLWTLVEEGRDLQRAKHKSMMAVHGHAIAQSAPEILTCSE